VGTHFEYAKKVLLKHAIVEKAFTTTVAEAEELVALATEKVKLSVFQNRRWDSDLKTVRQVLLDGVLGDIVEAEFHFDLQSPFKSQHKETANAGAGILKDLGLT
jgi:predicted dehydrogenase